MPLLPLLLLQVLLATPAPSAEPTGYHLLKTISILGDGSWDYVTVDEAARRVYLSHGTQVDILDADTFEIKGTVPFLHGVHGIALAPDLGRGFISNGRSNTVTVFDLTTLQKLSEVATGKNPDAIVYEPVTKRVFAFNGSSGNTTIIDAATSKVVGNIDLAGKPEFAVADGTGRIYVNLEDKNTLVQIDAKDLYVRRTSPLAPGDAPSSMALDSKNHRLFVGCRNNMLLVVEEDTGHVVTHFPIGSGVDATDFDSQTGQILSTCSDGTLTIVQQDTADKYHVIETLKTREKSRTFGMDKKTGRLFIPAADFKPVAGPTKDNPRPRPGMITKSFVVLVYGK